MAVANDDARLMLALKAEEPSAFAALVERYTALLFSLAFRYAGNAEDARDIVQDIFLRVYRAREGYEDRAKFSTWLYRVAVNACLDFKRRNRGDIVRLALPLDAPYPGDDGAALNLPDTSDLPPERELERRDQHETIEQALAALPEKQRLALLLKTTEDRPYQEIADMLDCSVSSVESLIFRARRSLQNKLTQK